MNLNHKRIVVTFLMHLGDVILTTPFFTCVATGGTSKPHYICNG